MKETKTYRCTLNYFYTSPSCDGHFDLSARQGYYISANTPIEALKKMRDKYPQESNKGVTVEIARKIWIWENAPKLSEDKESYFKWYHQVLCCSQKYLSCN